MGLSTFNRNREKRAADRSAAARPPVATLPSPRERALELELAQVRSELAAERTRAAKLEARSAEAEHEQARAAAASRVRR